MIVLETLERVAEPLPDDSEDGGMWRVCRMNLKKHWSFS